MDYNQLWIESWKKTTRWIFRSILGYAISFILTGVLAVVFFAIDGPMYMAAGLDLSVAQKLVMTIVVLLGLVMLGCGILFLKGLYNFQDDVHPKDKSTVMLLFYSIGAQLLNSIFGRIHWTLSILLLLAGAVAFLLCFYRLKISPTFPAKAREGASLLFWGMIGVIASSIIAGVVFSFSNTVGVIFIFAIIVGSMVVTSLGWWYIAKSDAPALTDEPQIQA